MDMIGYLLRLPNSEMEKILDDSALLKTGIENPETANAYKLDIHKTWEAVFFMLTGYPLAEWDSVQPPFSFVMFNLDQFVDEEQDLGFGPANYSTPEEVNQIAKALSVLTDADFKKRYKSKKMLELEIYPAGFWTDSDEVFYYLKTHFNNLKKFYAEASQNNEFVIAWLG